MAIGRVNVSSGSNIKKILRGSIKGQETQTLPDSVVPENSIIFTNSQYAYGEINKLEILTSTTIKFTNQTIVNPINYTLIEFQKFNKIIKDRFTIPYTSSTSLKQYNINLNDTVNPEKCLIFLQQDYDQRDGGFVYYHDLKTELTTNELIIYSKNSGTSASLSYFIVEF